MNPFSQQPVFLDARACSMNIIAFEDRHVERFHPVTWGRPARDHLRIVSAGRLAADVESLGESVSRSNLWQEQSPLRSRGRRQSAV